MKHKNIDDYFEKKILVGADIGRFVGVALATFTSGAIYWYYGKEVGNIVNNFFGITGEYARGSIDSYLMIPIAAPLFVGFMRAGDIIGGAIAGSFLRKKEGFKNFLIRKYYEENEKFDKIEKNVQKNYRIDK